MRNPKGLALLILGMIEDFKRTGDSYYLKEAENLGKWLINNPSDSIFGKIIVGISF